MEREIHLTPGNDVFFCYIRNVLWEESLADKDTPFIQRMLSVKPVFNAGEQRYCSLTGQDLGHWGEPRARLS